MANGINGAGTIVGGSGTAFSFAGGAATTLPSRRGSTAGGNLRHQRPGPDRRPVHRRQRQLALPQQQRHHHPNRRPVRSRLTLFAQGINNSGIVVGFYVGNDGQDHGFTFDSKTSTFTNVADFGSSPPSPEEPGATFVFSQILGVNDRGIAVGYYGDSTTSQHGFLYNTNTGTYTFLDDPSVQFNGNGVEVTQITGIANSGEIDGFFTDANGLQHGFFTSARARHDGG